MDALTGECAEEPADADCDRIPLQAGHGEKAGKAIKDHAFRDEIVGVSVPQRRGDPIMVLHDEFPRPTTQADGLAKLRHGDRNLRHKVRLGEASEL